MYYSYRQYHPCAHNYTRIHCPECRTDFCINCSDLYPYCRHGRSHNAMIEAKQNIRKLKEKYEILFRDVSHRMRGAIASYRMHASSSISDISRIEIQEIYRWYCSTLNNILENSSNVAYMLEKSLESSNPSAMEIAQKITMGELKVLEDLSYMTYLHTTYEGHNTLALINRNRCIYVQRNSINLFNYCRPIYGVTHPIVIKERKLSDMKAIGKRGQGNLEFCRPWGVACNAEGKGIVTDRSNDRIKVLDRNGEFLWQFGQTGVRVGDLHRPAGVTVNKDGNIVVADKDNHRVQIFTIYGEPLLAFGRMGSRPGEFYYPYSVHCNSNGEILVSDSKNQRIQLFQGDGVLLRIFKFGIRLSQHVKLCDTPRDVCFTPTGKILVTDFETHAILEFEGTLSRLPISFGSQGTGIGKFQRPQGIACDDAGNIVIADSKNHRIILWKCTGEIECILNGKGCEVLNRPCGICITPEGRLIVVDMGNDRLLFL